MNNSQDTYNKGGLIAFLFSVAFCFLFFIYIAFIHPGVNIVEVQEQAAEQAGQVMADAGLKKVDISKIPNPWVDNPDVVTHGASVFKTNCAVCHGPEGKGDGPAGAALQPPPRNLVEGKWKRGGTSQALFTTLHDGLEGTSMASFKHLPLADRWALVQFIRSITQNKGADDAAKLEAFAKTAN